MMPDHRKAVLVVGDDTDLASRIARMFAASRILVATIDRDGLSIGGERVSATNVSIDLSNAGAMRAQLAELQRQSIAIDSLVHLSRVADQTSILATDLAEFDRIVDGSLTSAFVAGQVFAGEIAHCGGGSVVILSMIGACPTSGANTIAAACQDAIVQLVKILTVDLASAQIRVNAIAADGEVADLDAIASAVVFLASEESAYVNGQIIVAGSLADNHIMVPEVAKEV